MDTSQRNSRIRDTIGIAQEGRSEVDNRLVEALRSFIPHVMRQNGTPGLNIALARCGEMIWEEGFGYADLEKKTPMTPQTVMHSGSMGKLYTATAVMQLVELGVIGLYHPINRYLKDFRVVNPLGEREITFYDLLTHRSGLTRQRAGSEFVAPKPLGEHLRETYAQKMFKPYDRSVLPVWSAKVGERFQYSNFGMATLGYLVELTNPEGLSFSDYVQNHIIDPLGMKSSQYPPVQDASHVRPDIFERLSTGYAHFGPVYIPTPTVYFADYPAGTVVTTPGDHIRLALAFLNGGYYQGHRLLRADTVRLMLTPQVKVRGVQTREDREVGLVWWLSDIGTEDHSISHGGAHMFGWHNLLIAYPVPDVALVIATNHWPMVPDLIVSGNEEQTPQLVATFVSLWLKGEKAKKHRAQPASSWTWEPFYANSYSAQPASSWAWKISYVIGLIMVERLKGGLGIGSPLTEETVEAMATGAKVRTEAENGVAVWDPAGFRAGVQDMLSVEMTPTAIRAFLESDRLQIPSEELEILYRELGSRGLSVLPHAMWSAAG
jgi:CubicO group peptidase (beta-lactamase class C family)